MNESHYGTAIPRYIRTTTINSHELDAQPLHTTITAINISGQRHNSIRLTGMPSTRQCTCAHHAPEHGSRNLHVASLAPLKCFQDVSIGWNQNAHAVTQLLKIVNMLSNARLKVVEKSYSSHCLNYMIG